MQAEAQARAERANNALKRETAETQRGESDRGRLWNRRGGREGERDGDWLFSSHRAYRSTSALSNPTWASFMSFKKDSLTRLNSGPHD
jgi:hypothetical protein